MSLKKYGIEAIFFIFSVFCFAQEKVISQGEKLFLDNKPEQAVMLLEEEIRNKRNSVNAYNYLGLAYYQLGQYEKSVESFNKGLSIDGTDRKLLAYNQGNSFFAMKKYIEAAKSYSLAIAEDGEYTQALLNRANSYTMGREYEKAVNDYTVFIGLRPEDEQKEQIELLIQALTAEMVRIALEKQQAEAEIERVAIDDSVIEEEKNRLRDTAVEVGIVSDEEIYDAEEKIDTQSLLEEFNQLYLEEARIAQEAKEELARLEEEKRLAEEKLAEIEKLEAERMKEESEIIKAEIEQLRKEDEKIANAKREEEARIEEEKRQEEQRIAELKQIEIEQKQEELRIEAEKLAEERKLLEESKLAEERRIEEERRAAEERRIAEEAERRRKLLEDVANSLQNSGSTNMSSGAEDLMEYDQESELD